MTLEAILPSAMASSIPVTVTVCATFQSPLVKVSVAGKAVASDRSDALTEITTSVSGWASSTTVKLAVVPVSDTVSGPPTTV